MHPGGRHTPLYFQWPLIPFRLLPPATNVGGRTLDPCRADCAARHGSRALFAPAIHALRRLRLGRSRANRVCRRTERGAGKPYVALRTIRRRRQRCKVTRELSAAGAETTSPFIAALSRFTPQYSPDSHSILQIHGNTLNQRRNSLRHTTKNRLPDPSETCAPEFKEEFRRSVMRSVSATTDVDCSILLKTFHEGSVASLAQKTVSDGEARIRPWCGPRASCDTGAPIVD